MQTDLFDSKLIKLNRNKNHSQLLDSGAFDGLSSLSSTSIPALSLPSLHRSLLRSPKMAFRARIAQHIEIHRESRFPSLFPSAENEATRFDPRVTTPLASSLTYAQRVSYTYLFFLLPVSPSRVVLFYSPSTSAFASAATPFNLAPGSVPPCPYLIRLSLASDRFTRTRLFLSLSLSLERCACFCISQRYTGICGDHTSRFQSFSDSLVCRAHFVFISSACHAYDRFTCVFPIPPLFILYVRVDESRSMIDH